MTKQRKRKPAKRAKSSRIEIWKEKVFASYPPSIISLSELQGV